jgi:hypothetical protein
MSYNNMSGTVFMPTEFLTRPDAIAPTVLSGNLSTSDAADVINVPRVSNATNNAILTNVGGDANALVCESNLTFDGILRPQREHPCRGPSTYRPALLCRSQVLYILAHPYRHRVFMATVVI